jgi:phage baseplate assembly protein gpV
MSDHDLLVELADLLRHRHFGKYRGTVADVDPTTLRIRAVVPAVLGDVATDWCLPCVPFAGPDVGLFLIPAPGSAVWIEFEGGDVSAPIWSGCLWRSGELPGDAAPDVRGLVTYAPHKLLFDDDASSATLTGVNDNTVTLDGAGITLESGGQSLVVGGGSVCANDGAMTVT